MIYLLNPIHATVLAGHWQILKPRLVVVLNQSKKDFTMPNPSKVAPSFTDAQDTFNQTMCQAQAVVMALSGDDQFKYMKTDHVASLLSLTHQHREQLNASYSDLLIALKAGGD